MKRTYDSSRYIFLLVKAGLIASIATVLLMPTAIRASSQEALPRVEQAWPMLKRASSDALPLPPISYLETMPCVRERTPKGFKIDTLLGPKFELTRPEIASGGVSQPASSSKAQIPPAAEEGHASL